MSSSVQDSGGIINNKKNLYCAANASKNAHTHTHTLCYESYDKVKDNHLQANGSDLSWTLSRLNAHLRIMTSSSPKKCHYEGLIYHILPLSQTFITSSANTGGLTVTIIPLYVTFSFSNIKMLLHISKGYEKCWKMHLISYGLTVELLSD